MTTERYDFRGGYATDLVPERMDSNMVLEGQNLWYKGKLQSRPGWTNLSVHASSNESCVGFCRAYINSTWYNVVALDDVSDSGVVNFYYGDTGAYTAIDNNFDWTTATNVQMVFFNDAVVAVNGTDKPAIIYYDSGWVVKNLEDYDERTRGTDEWYAGLYDASETPPFVDDTADAQSTTASDFAVSNGTSGDGFYVACATIFNKVVLYGCEDIGTDVTGTYEYYAGSGTWTSLTATAEPDWDGAEATKTLTFDIPLDSDGLLLWKKYGDVSDQDDAVNAAGDTVPGGAVNEYILRVTFTTTTTLSAGDCDYLEISHTQYLTQIFRNDKPESVAVHKHRLYLATGRAFRYAPPNQLKGWESDNIEYCHEGGEKIVAMVSAADYLAVFKEAGIYRYLGTTTENFVLRYTPAEGCVSPRGAASISGNPVYIADDGIRTIMNDRSVVLSRHIQSDMDGWTKTNAVVVEWQGNVLVSFPSNDIILWADVDTMRNDEMGDGRLSLWEWTTLAADQIVYASGSGDNGYLILHDMDNDRFVRNTTNGYDVAFDTTQTAITQTFQTKYDSFGDPAVKKAFKRQKMEMSESGAWTATIYSNNADANATKTIASGSGTGHHIEDVSIPYTLDGYNLSTKLVNATTNAVEIYGFTTEYERRAF